MASHLNPHCTSSPVSHFSLSNRTQYPTFDTSCSSLVCFFFQAEDGIRDLTVTGVQTCALPILGDFEAGALALVESSLKYQPGLFAVLTLARESGPGTVHGGQFDWGGLLPKSNGGVRRYARYGRKSY